MPGHPVREDDVRREQHRVGEGEGHAQRRARQPHVGEEVNAGDGERQRPRVAGAASAHRRQGDHRQELDRGHGPQRQPVDRHVEAAVHRGQDRAPRGQQAPPGAIERRERPPRAAPGGEDRRGGGDPQPGHAQHVHPREQQHRERGPQVVEHGADQEPGVRRRPLHERAAARPPARWTQCSGLRLHDAGASQAKPCLTMLHRRDMVSSTCESSSLGRIRRRSC